MEIIQDLGLRDAGSRTRRFVLARCQICNSVQEVRADSEVLKNDMCRTCKGFAEVLPGKTSTTLEFITKAKNIHKGIYTYSNSVFIKSSEKTAVTCNYHGDFQISPNNHLRGKGCPECALIKRGWNRGIYANSPAILYLIKVNDLLYKVGITRRTIQERFSKDLNNGVTIEILQEQHFFEGTDAYDLEKLILAQTSANKYKGPLLLSHGGDTELRLIDCSDIFLKYIKEYNEIN